MKPLTILAGLLLLSACTTPLPITIADQGTAVVLNQPVHVGRLVATPQAVVEGSRCPQNARCIWAGRLVVSTRIDGDGWHETVPLTLGERQQIGGTSITLVSGTPERRTEAPTRLRDYRFVFEGGS